MILYDLLHSEGVRKVLDIMNLIIGAIRWVVPIGLIVMTSIDVFNKVINPDDKEGQKKIMTRIIAAIIVFLLPTIINLIMRLVDIGNGNSNSKNNNANNNTSQKDTKKDNNIDIMYCPKDEIMVGSSLSLSAITSENFDGSLIWSANYNNDVILLEPLNNGKILNYTLISYPSSGFVTITLRNNTVFKTCDVKVTKPKETPVEKVKILNCPNDDKVYDKGDKLTLNADGTNINWTMYTAKEYLNITPSSDGKSASIEVMDYYPAGSVTVIAEGKGSYEMCKINIRNQVRTEGTVLVNNCPKDKIKIGETFTLSTNEDVDWYNDIYSNYYEIVSSTPRSAIIKVIGNYSNYLPVRIRVKNNSNQVGYCSFYTHE